MRLLPGLLLLLLFLPFPPAAAEASAGEDLLLVVQSDSRGELRPCHCPGNPAGGLSRRSGVIERIRRGQVPTVILDGGDFVPAPGESLREETAEFMVRAMQLIGYEAVGLGELELFLDPGELASAAGRLPLVCANTRFGGEGAPEIPAVRWIERDGRRIAVTGIVDPMLYYTWEGAFERAPEVLTVMDPLEALEEIRAELEEADLVVLLAHADLATTLGIVEGFEGIDVVVQGHEPELGSRPTALGATLVIEPGPRSRQVVKIAVRATESGWADAGYQVHDLKLATQDDARIDALLEEFEREFGAR